MILFDICGAGALGYLFVQSGLAHQAFTTLQGMVPLLFVPFLFAVLIQTAQGSRLVTAVITADILAGSSVVSAFHPFALILAITGGACILSYVTDPYFWIIQKATNDDAMTVIRRYTLPLAGIGVVLFVIAGIAQMVAG
jgi:GntP family gluconate:H+ symporter